MVYLAREPNRIPPWLVALSLVHSTRRHCVQYSSISDEWSIFYGTFGYRCRHGSLYLGSPTNCSLGRLFAPAFYTYFFGHFCHWYVFLAARFLFHAALRKIHTCNQHCKYSPLGRCMCRLCFRENALFCPPPQTLRAY